jgi:hypothetical protein
VHLRTMSVCVKKKMKNIKKLNSTRQVNDMNILLCIDCIGIKKNLLFPREKVLRRQVYYTKCTNIHHYTDTQIHRRTDTHTHTNTHFIECAMIYILYGENRKTLLSLPLPTGGTQLTKAESDDTRSCSI